MLFVNEQVVKQELITHQNTCHSDVSFLFSQLKWSFTEMQARTLLHPAAALVLQECKSPELAWDQSWPPDFCFSFIYENELFPT